MSQEDFKRGLQAAARHLNRDADDYSQMERQTLSLKFSQLPSFEARAAKTRADQFRQKAELLRGRFNRYERRINMTNEVASTKTFQEKMFERIRDQIGDSRCTLQITLSCEWTSEWRMGVITRKNPNSWEFQS